MDTSQFGQSSFTTRECSISRKNGEFKANKVCHDSLLFEPALLSGHPKVPESQRVIADLNFVPLSFEVTKDIKIEGSNLIIILVMRTLVQPK